MSAMEILVRYGYAVVFGTVLGEQIGLPIPAIPVMLAAGALVGGGHLNLMLLLALSGVASLMADTAWYWIGRAGGARVLGLLCRISLERDTCVRKTEGIFARHGARSLLIAKFIPGFSTIAPPLAGVVRMPFTHFLFFSGLGGLFWSGVFIAVGWVFTNQIEMVGGYIARLGGWILALIVVALGGYIGAKYISRRRFLRKMRIARITPEELKTKLDGGEEMIVVDVRDRIDFDAEPAIIPGALHLTTEELEARHQEIPREREIVLYCTCPSEETSARAALLLRRRGIERIRPLAGGYHGWRDRGYPMTELTIATNGGTHA
jgi:membrane protein DedA with SNARE-associated domain/rhodanese-related sulfurtransferase